MSKNAIAFVLPLSLLAAFSIFSIEITPKSYSELQYQLNTDEATLIVNEDNGPVVPGEGRKEASTEQA